jgi:phosphatidylglycerophosphate synthase
VTPNHLTVARLVTGLGAGGAIAVGEPQWGHVGAGLFLVSMLLDRADGELARMTRTFSPLGHKLDLVSDALCNTLIFVALGIGLRGEAFPISPLVMGIAAGLAVASILLLVVRLEGTAGERAGELPGLAGFDADDGMLAVPLLIWLGCADWLLVAAFVGAPAFAVFMAVRAVRQLRAARASAAT